MSENYKKKETYEYCRIRNIMVRLEIIESTLTTPDFVEAKAKLVPVDCNKSRECKSKEISCIVYDKNGMDPCPEAWNG